MFEKFIAKISIVLHNIKTSSYLLLRIKMNLILGRLYVWGEEFSIIIMLSVIQVIDFDGGLPLK